MNSKKGRGKRFLASFLAVLMAVTLLPVNAVGIAYAEELDAIEIEAPDSVVAVDEETETADSVVAADEETEATDNVATADEETDEPQVNDAESSEDVETGDSLTADEEDLALEEVVPELEAAVAVASEEVLEPAEVSAAVAADTTGYVERTNTKVRSWTFNKTYFNSKNISAGNITSSSDLDGITLNADSASGTVKAKMSDSEEDLSINANGIIDIPVDTDTDAIAIEITLQSNNSARYIDIGTGDTWERVYHSNDSKGAYATAEEGSPYFDSNKYYTNATLYTEEAGMFSTVLSIKGYVGETKIASIVLHEYEKIKPVNLNDPTAAVELSLVEGDAKAQTAAYTGQPFDLDVLNLSVTTGTGESKVEANPQAYTTSFLRETSTDTYEATNDLTSVGKIKVKVTSGEGAAATVKESNAFEITPANLATTDKKEPVNKSDIDSTNGYPGTVDLSALVTPLSEDDEFEYTLSEETGYDAGAVVETTDNDKKPAITGSTLTYTVKADADVSSAETVLLVKVTSSNYNDAYIKVTVSVMDKPAVTVSGNSVEKEYDGQAYGFKANAVIAVTGASGDAITEETAIANIKNNLNYTFTKVGASAAEPSEPTDAGVYNVDAELTTGSTYTMTEYKTTDSGDSVQLTIKKRTITIIPNGGTWDKTFDSPLTAKTSDDVTDADYTFKNGKGLVTGDTMTQPSIKYRKRGETAELTTAGWNDLKEGDIVEVVADGANAGSNYDIKYEVGTIEVKQTKPTEIAAIAGEGSTLLMTDIPADKLNNSVVAKDTLVKGFLLTGGGSSTSAKSVSANGKNYTLSLKSSGNGDQYSKSIGFTIDKPATLYIVAHTDGGDTTRKMAVSKLDTNYQLVECVGTKYSKDTTKDLTYAAGGIDIDTSANYLSIELDTAGTYYIYAPGSGLRIYEVTVTYEEGEEDTVEFTTDPTLATTQGATLTTPHPGDVLTVSYALNLAAGKTDASTIAWYRVKDGQDTPLDADTSDATGKTYTVVAGDIGSKIKVVVTPKDSAGTTGTAKDVETGTVRAAGEENIGFTTAPTLSISTGGDLQAPKPDDVLTVSYELNAQGTDASTVEWYRGDTKIDTATGRTYTVTTADIGSVITVKVTPKIEGGEAGTTETDSTGTVVSGQQGGTITLTGVTLSGEAKVGKTLTATLTFDPVQTSVPTGVTYKWYRVSDGTPTEISGATGDRYTLTDDDEGKAIKVVVTYGETEKDFTSSTVAADTSATTGEGLEIEFVDGKVYTYTGAKIMPLIKVTNNGDALVEGTDYTVSYTNNLKAAAAPETGYDKKAPGVTVTGKGNLSGKTSANFTIKPKSLSNADDANSANDTAEVIANKVVVVEKAKAVPVVLYNGVKLTAKDYDITAPTDIKTKKWELTDVDGEIKLEGKGNFTGECTLDVTVISKEASKTSKITANFEDTTAVKSLTYTGSPIEPAFTVSNKAKATDLVADTDYVISYPKDTTNAGAKKVTILGISEKCTGSVTKSYTIKPAKGGTLTVTGVKASYGFVSTGVTFGDEVTVSYVDETNSINRELTNGVDYKITYSNNKKASDKAGYVVTGLGNYKGLKTAKQNFTIGGLALSDSDSDIKVVVGDKLFTKAGVYKSVPSVIVNGELVKASEYTVSYKVGDETDFSAKPSRIESIDAATGYVTVQVQIKAKKATGNYGAAVTEGDELKGEYKVVSSDTKKDLAKAKVVFYTKDGAKASKVGYTGKDVTPYKAVISCKGAEDVTIILEGDDADYATKGFDVTYANNVLKGKATVVIEAKDDNTVYAGSKTATFNIVQKNLQKDLGANEGFINSMSSFLKPFFN